MASSLKIFAWQKFVFETQLSFFKKYGITRRDMFLVGLNEMIATILLLFSLIYNSSLFLLIGALIIASTSFGAIFFHLKFDTFKDAIPAILTLSGSSYLLFNNALFLSFF